MRSSRVVRASGCRFQTRNSPGFDPTILRHSEILGAADDAVLNNVHKTKKRKKTQPTLNKKISLPVPNLTYIVHICSSTGFTSCLVLSLPLSCLVLSLTLFARPHVREHLHHDSRLTKRLRKSACRGPNIFKDIKPQISAFPKNWPVKVYLAAGVYLSEALSFIGFCFGQ
jgi:hypothetical protein